MSRNNLEIFYIPVVDVDSEQIVGFKLDPPLEDSSSPSKSLLNLKRDSNEETYRDMIVTTLRPGSENAHDWLKSFDLPDKLFLQTPISSIPVDRSSFASLLQNIETKVPHDFRISLGFKEQELEERLSEDSIQLLENQFPRLGLTVRDFGQGFSPDSFDPIILSFKRQVP